MLKLTKQVMLIAFLAVTVFTSCSKENVEADQPITLSQEEKKIDSLKIFMSKQVGVAVKDINYDGNTQMFSMFGYDQINLEKLTELYNVNREKQ